MRCAKTWCQGSGAGAGASGWGGRCASGPVGRRQVTESIDVFPGRCGAGVFLRTAALAGRTSGRAHWECLAAASATQSIGDPGRWRLSDAGCGGRLRQVSIAGWHVGRAREWLGRRALGRDGLSGKGGRAQVRSYGGVGVGGIFPDRLGCRRSALGRDGPSGKGGRAQVRSYGGVGVGGIFPDRLGCCRSAPGRDRPSRQARRATGALWLGGLS
ncbi:hypothetical protein FHY31_003089 [Xanthomonas euvesicatoria]|uniref:Uncharacterized protein n=1 Tax=Xanthomonas euvesicatoria TaxID=456327 RepID=A0AAW3U7Q8_XANEU|nr:hypothetical protein [Xanthomonas euvesicatoria]MBB4871313.1 hypothetical protein [Xanthomonas euvesicatoria]